MVDISLSEDIDCYSLTIAEVVRVGIDSADFISFTTYSIQGETTTATSGEAG